MKSLLKMALIGLLAVSTTTYAADGKKRQKKARQAKTMTCPATCTPACAPTCGTMACCK